MKNIAIHPYRPGLIGEVVRNHATYYATHWAFDVRFETQVAQELSEFVTEFDPTRDGFWWAANGEEFAGAIAVNGSRERNWQARIRWFIVPKQFQGGGLGSTLMDKALDFCRIQQFRSVYLWTFEGLAAARKLYERTGFRLVEEQQGAPWGPAITEQKFELTL